MEKKKNGEIQYNGTATLWRTGDNALSRNIDSGRLQNTGDVLTFLTFLAPDANICLHFCPGVALIQQTRADEKKTLASAELLHDSLGR